MFRRNIRNSRLCFSLSPFYLSIVFLSLSSSILSVVSNFDPGTCGLRAYHTSAAVVDRVSKYARLLALSHSFSASTLAQGFLDHIYRLHGAPVEVVSDRDPVFISNFWKEFLKVIKVEQKLASYYSQTNGQSKILNQCLETYLRCMCWESPKALAKWWYNTSFHTSIKATPYNCSVGRNYQFRLLACLEQL